MVPRLLLLALVAALGGLAAALLADEPAGPASRAVLMAVPSVAEAPTPTAEAPTATAEAEPPSVTSTATVPSIRRRARRPARAPVIRSPALRVPAVVGFREQVAIAALQRARLRAIVRRLAVSRRSSDGIVTRQFPAAGLRVPSGTPVTLFVAVYTGR